MRGKGVFIDTISIQYLLKIKMYYLIYIYILALLFIDPSNRIYKMYLIISIKTFLPSLFLPLTCNMYCRHHLINNSMNISYFIFIYIISLI
jgi:hypothetical protein